MAVTLLGGAWLYVDHLQSDNAALKNRVVVLTQDNKLLRADADALADELQAAAARAQAYQSIKEKISASPSGTVPADIRAALDGLRDH